MFIGVILFKECIGSVFELFKTVWKLGYVSVNFSKDEIFFGQDFFYFLKTFLIRTGQSTWSIEMVFLIHLDPLRLKLQFVEVVLFM